MEKRLHIGIVAAVLTRDHIRSIVRGALKQAQECGCDVTVLAPLAHFTRKPGVHADTERRLYQLIDSGEFDGFLYIKDDATMGSEVIAELEKRLASSDRFVMTVDEKDSQLFDCTQYDDYYDFSKVVEHLVQVHGYRRIYCITGPEQLFQAQTRLRAFLDVMAKYSLPCDESCWEYGTFWVDSAERLAGKLISGEMPLPEAIVCGNDIMAVSLIKCLIGAGIKVPEDVAVTGYDGYPFSANLDVTLTTYVRNQYQLGADAFRRLYRNITGRLCRKVVRPDTGFVVGSSCGCKTIPANQALMRQNNARPKMWEEEVFCDDMGYDLSGASDLSDLLRRALSHFYIMYQAKSVRVYLTEEYLSNAGVKGVSGSADSVRLCGYTGEWGEPLLCSGEPFPLSHVSGFLGDEPEAVYLSMLHAGERISGYITLSYGGMDMVYDENYLRFVSCLSIALDSLAKLRRICTSSREGGVRQRKNSEMYEKLTSLRRELEQSPEIPRTTETMCQQTGMSKSALQKNYRALFGQSIFEDLIAFRIAKAKNLLDTTDMPIVKVAEMCGYSSESYFMKQFRRETGMTPTEFRNK